MDDAVEAVLVRKSGRPFYREGVVRAVPGRVVEVPEGLAEAVLRF